MSSPWLSQEDREINPVEKYTKPWIEEICVNVVPPDATAGQYWEKGMKEIVDVLGTAASSKVERAAARAAFLRRRADNWKDIQEERFPAIYISSGREKFVGAPRKTAIRCDFLLANKIALGKQYAADHISDMAQRACCPKCTAKLYEYVSAKVFRYIDNAKWKAAIEGGRNVSSEP